MLPQKFNINEFIMNGLCVERRTAGDQRTGGDSDDRVCCLCDQNCSFQKITGISDGVWPGQAATNRRRRIKRDCLTEARNELQCERHPRIEPAEFSLFR